MAKNKKDLFHPRPYLSHSQMRLFDKNKEDFIQHYVYGKDTISRFVKKYVEFGSKIHKQLENEEPNVWNVLNKIPENYSENEKNVNVEYCGVNVFGKWDVSRDDDLLVVGDYKTSKSKWSQKEADKNEQLTLYGLQALLLYDRIPDYFYIHRIGVGERDDGSLYLTGEVQNLKTKRTEKEINKMKMKVLDYWNKIGKLCGEELNRIF